MELPAMRVKIEEVPNVCKYCRKIMKHLDYPKTLEIYRGEMPCLTVDVEKASKLVLNEDTLRYGEYDEMEVIRLEGLRKRTGSGH